MPDTITVVGLVAELRAEIARLQSDLTDALDIAEASAKQCNKLRAALEGLIQWAETDTLQPEGTLQRRLMAAHAALAPEEEPR